jgi:uncharacterized protein (TIGR00252 family)
MGDLAEDEVANYLTREGHEVLARNWKTKFCEIDIVSRKNSTLYFTEVKYRKQAAQGGGLAAITPKKLEQMTFAARLFTASHPNTHELLLAVASVTGEPPRIQQWFELG